MAVVEDFPDLKDFRAVGKRLSNWGRWGPDDERGTLRDMGITLGEILDFEELAADCAGDGVYEFLFCAPALKFTNGAGTPINPLAVK